MKRQIPSSKEIAQGIRIRMAELEMSKKELAEKTGFTSHKITVMCSGAHDFSINEVVALEQALDMDIMLVPDTERVITVTMHIDNNKHQATVDTVVTENGKVLKDREDWTVRKLVSSANALTTIVRRMQELVMYELLEEGEE